MKRRWPIVRLGELLQSISRPEPVDPAKEYRLLGIRLDGRGPFLRETVIGGQIAATKLSRVASGDFIYSRLFAWRGAFGCIDATLTGCYVSGEFPTFLSNSQRLDFRFLRYWFRLPTTLAEVDDKCSGSTPLTRNRFKEEFFLALEMPLPPIEEQRRIVARIEQLAAQIEEARTLRTQAAAEGDALMFSTLGYRFASLARESSTRPLGELCSHILDGPHVTPNYLQDGAPGVPFVTVKNMVTGQLNFCDLNYISDDDHTTFTRRCKPERGDVLYSKDGATRGRPCFVDTDREFSYFVSVALIKPLREALDGRFLVHLLNSNWIKDRMTEKSRGDMIPHIVLGEIRSFPVPVLTISEQRQIVTELDKLQSEVDALKRMQAETAAELDALLPAILDRAFKGEL